MSAYTVYHRVIKLSLHPGFLKNIKIQQEYCWKKEAKNLFVFRRIHGNTRLYHACADVYFASRRGYNELVKRNEVLVSAARGSGDRVQNPFPLRK